MVRCFLTFNDITKINRLNYRFRIAQWDPTTQRYYYVQTANGKTTWEIPTQEAPNTPTPTTPSPYPAPAEYNQHGQPTQSGYGDHQSLGGYTPQTQYVPQPESQTTSTRAGGFGGIAGTMAQSMLGGGKKNSGHSSGGLGGLGGLASGLLSGGGKHPSGGSGHGGHSGGGGLFGQAAGIAGGLLGGKNKPQHGAQGGHSSGGLGGLVGGILGGGSHGQTVCISPLQTCTVLL